MTREHHPLSWPLRHAYRDTGQLKPGRGTWICSAGASWRHHGGRRRARKEEVRRHEVTGEVLLSASSREGGIFSGALH